MIQQAEVIPEPTSMARDIARRSLDGPQLAVRSITPEDIYDAWLEGRNARTQRAYEADLRDFAAFLRLDTSNQATVALVAAGHANANRIALAYRADMASRGLAASTIAHRLAALRSMLKLARQIGQITWNLDVESPKVQTYRDTRGPGDDGWKAIRQRAADRAKGGEPVRVRDRAILRVTHDLGLRVSELVGLDLADVELLGEVPSAVWILGKNRTAKEMLSLAEPTAQALRQWI